MERYSALTVIFVLAFSQLGNGFAIQEEIYNGLNARRGQFPYQTMQVHINKYYGNFSQCGGSLISTEYVLTAAHCIKDVSTSLVYVGMTVYPVFDTVRVYNVSEDGQFMNPNYIPDKTTYDIAILRLPTSVTLNEYVSLIKLPQYSDAPVDTYDNAMATATGWGKTYDDEQGIHSNLQYRTLHIWEHSDCVDFFAKMVLEVNDGLICTDKSALVSGPCKGDSGGPLAVNNSDGEPMVIGVVNWSVGQCSDAYPNVFAYVPYYLNWINEVTGIQIN